MSEASKRKCPACSARRLQRVIGAGAGIIFKGSGFYQTDYRSESYKKGAEADTKSAEPKAEPKKEKEATGGTASEPAKKETKKEPKKTGDGAS
jgi:hypothetical protein